MKGQLYLADGSLYEGEGFGAAATCVGELVFNTSMTGYQKILTDPSYCGQDLRIWAGGTGGLRRAVKLSQREDA